MALWVAGRSSPSVPASFGAATESMVEIRAVNLAALPESNGDYVLHLQGRVSTYSAGTSTVRVRLGGSWTLADGTELLSFSVTANGLFTADVEIDPSVFVGTLPIKVTGEHNGGGTQPKIEEMTLSIAGT